MKGSGGEVENIEERGKLSPDGGCKLRSLVIGKDVRNRKVSNLGGTESISTDSGRGGGKRTSFCPACGAVYHSENECVA